MTFRNSNTKNTVQDNNIPTRKISKKKSLYSFYA